MRTPDRIIDASLKLFNADGVAKVSTNRIAAEAGSTPGNLYYHFKTKQQIVDRLMRRFEAKLSPLLDNDRSLGAIDDVWLLLHLGFEIGHEYRFIFRDVDYLTREYPDLQPKFQAIVARSIANCRKIGLDLRDSGALEASDEDIESIAFNIVFMSACWSTFARMLPPQGDSSGVAAYRVLTMLTPYLRGEARHYLDYMRSKYLRRGTQR
jgi:AcrR family transcriptional regulator